VTVGTGEIGRARNRANSVSGSRQLRQVIGVVNTDGEGRRAGGKKYASRGHGRHPISVSRQGRFLNFFIR
jgi:hypothetical protein